MKKIVKIFFLYIIFSFNIIGSEIDSIKFQEELNFKGLELSDVAAILTEESGVTILVDRKIKDKVIDSYFLKGERLGKVLNLIANTNNLKLQKTANGTYIFQEGSEGGNSLSGVVKLSGYNAGVDDVKITVMNSGVVETYTEYGGKYIINNLLPGSYIVKFEKNGYYTEGEFITIGDKDKNKKLDISLVKNGKEVEITGTPKLKENISNSKLHIESDDKVTEKITLVNISSDEVKKILESTLNSDVVITSFPKLNILLIKGQPNLVRIAKDISQDMDVQMKQVRIAAQTLEITDNLFENLGFSWAYQSGSLKDLPKASPLPGEPINGIERTISSSGTNTGILNVKGGDGLGTNINFVKFFNDKNDFLNFSINLLQGTTDATVSAIPSIIVLNGEIGKFDITEETLVSYKTTNVYVGDENQINTEPITGNAGIILEVTPIIKTDNSILLKIDVEVSNFTGNSSTITAQGGYNPKVTRKLSTTVTIKDKDTIFIGGMKSASSSSYNSQVPFFADLPLVGPLFKSKGVTNNIKDLYIKLKVDIVDSEEAKEEIDYSQFKMMEIHDKNYKKIF
ncbi:MAG: carboxypeptidase regulatory-like domain-containing protein [Fusobacteriaceae bacterium]|nr:carboxypeptidase regulatory-like domain-containing protein [Fusobacteriaceae bacterium]